jgi:hypothetical protein
MTVQNVLRRKIREHLAGEQPYLSSGEAVVVFCCCGGDWPKEWEGFTVGQMLRYLSPAWIQFIVDFDPNEINE